MKLMWIFFLGLCFSANTFADDFARCQYISNTHNKDLPLRVDKITNFTSTKCTQGEGGSRVIYQVNLEIDNSTIPQIKELHSLKALVEDKFAMRQIITRCTDPKNAEISQKFDTLVKVFTHEGIFVTEIPIAQELCKLMNNNKK